MKHNYQLDLDEIINNLDGRRPRLLLQSCCGPCSSYVLEYLTQYFDVTLLWYNPNIYPEEEFDKRFDYQQKVIEKMNLSQSVPVIPVTYDHQEFLNRTEGLEAEPEGGRRCTECFELRLSKTAQTAKEQGFEWFCTTLTVSPHKDAERLNRIGAELAEQYGIKFLPSDFKKRNGYKRSIELSREMDIYRQEYCGCEFAMRAEEEETAQS